MTLTLKWNVWTHNYTNLPKSVTSLYLTYPTYTDTILPKTLRVLKIGEYSRFDIGPSVRNTYLTTIITKFELCIYDSSVKLLPHTLTHLECKALGSVESFVHLPRALRVLIVDRVYVERNAIKHRKCLALLPPNLEIFKYLDTEIDRHRQNLQKSIFPLRVFDRHCVGVLPKTLKCLMLNYTFSAKVFPLLPPSLNLLIGLFSKNFKKQCTEKFPSLMLQKLILKQEDD
jgi:hypothetical protein